jgi:hypothetical protein
MFLFLVCGIFAHLRVNFVFGSAKERRYMIKLNLGCLIDLSTITDCFYRRICTPIKPYKNRFNLCKIQNVERLNCTTMPSKLFQILLGVSNAVLAMISGCFVNFFRHFMVDTVDHPQLPKPLSFPSSSLAIMPIDLLQLAIRLFLNVQNCTRFLRQS